MFRIFRKAKKHRIIKDEQGRSAKKQAFDLYNKGYPTIPNIQRKADTCAHEDIAKIL